MKKSLLLFLFIFSLSAKAQTNVYHPFPDSNAVWNIISSSPCSAGFADKYYFSYIITIDTIIGFYNYHKIEIPFIIDSSECWPYYSAGPGYYVGAFRQDVSKKKVYFIERGNSLENLLYNFDLHVGDTIRGFLIDHNCLDDSIISKEDSILINGNYRRRWELSLMYPTPNYIIEGIGFTGGPLTPLCSWFEGGTLLTCFTQNNILLYKDTDSYLGNVSCDLISGINNFSEKNIPISIYPNPLTTSSILQLNTQLKNAEVVIYDMLGKEMVRKKMDGDKMEIDKGSLESGVYFVRVSSEERQWVQKIIIQ